MITRNLLIRLGLLLALVGMGVFGVRWWTSPDRQIGRIADAVARALTHDGADVGFDTLRAVAGLQEHLTSEVTLEAGDGRGLRGREEVMAAAARLRGTTSYMRVRFFDVRVMYANDAAATVHATLDVTTRDGSGASVAEARAIEVGVVRPERRWQVARARLLGRLTSSDR